MRTSSQTFRTFVRNRTRQTGRQGALLPCLPFLVCRRWLIQRPKTTVRQGDRVRTEKWPRGDVVVVADRSYQVQVMKEEGPLALKPIFTLSPCLDLHKIMNSLRKNPDRVNGQGKSAPCLPVWTIATFASNKFCLNTRKFGKPGLTQLGGFIPSRSAHNERTAMTPRRTGPQAKPKSEKFVPTMVKMEPKLRADLERLADENNMTLSAYLRRLAEQHVQYAQAA